MNIDLKIINDITPVFSWVVKDCPDKRQTAYRIMVSTTDGDVVWDSGDVVSDNSVFVEYGGDELKENTKYLWKVTVVTENARYESEQSYFITGLHNFDDVKWISPDKNIISPIVYKEFDIKSVNEYATLNICGLGFFEVYINGTKVSDELMNPVRTDYDSIEYIDVKYEHNHTTRKSVKYLTYEVARYLKEGTNKIAVWLGNGWYRFKGRTRIVEGKFDYGDELKMFFKLTNGDQVIESDTDCYCTDSPIVYDNLFYGEIYDSRIKGERYSVHKATAPSGKIEPQLCPPERIIKTYNPVLVKDGVYDAGICMTGFAEIVCSGNKGDKIEIYYSEDIDDNGELDYTSTVGYEESDADQIQKDVYILSGNGDEVYRPRFVWHGYRYFKIDVSGEVDIKSVKAHYVCTDLKTRASFKSSNKLMNDIHNIFVNAQLSNTHGCVPMDCPHRERLGYTGDGELSSMSLMYNFDAHQMYRKWIDDILDSQSFVDGFVPHTAPFYGGGGGPAWGSAVAVVPWNLYIQYGDIEIVKKCKPHIKLWLEYLKSRTENGLVTHENPGSWCLGDWCMPSKYPWSEPHLDEIKLPSELVNTVYYIYCIDIYNKFAEIINEKSEYLNERAEAVKALDTFYANGNYAGGEQGSNLFPLFAGVAKDENTVLENTVKRIEDKNYVFETGISGNKFLLEVLDRYNRNDLAVKMMLGTNYPSFGHMIKNGATSLWETWEGNGAKNHTAFSSCSSWFFYGLAGIKPYAGYKEFSIKPCFADELDWVDVSVESEYGAIVLKWERKNGKINVEICVPFNTTAHIDLNGNKFDLNAGIYNKEVFLDETL